MKKKLIQINDQLLKKLEKIQIDNGIDSMSETIKHCIRVCYSKENPAYSSLKTTPEEKVKKEKRTQENICKMLGGKIITDNLGEQVCEYFTYTEVAGGEVESLRNTKPLEFLSEDLKTKQFTDILGQPMSDNKKAKYNLSTPLN